MAHRIERGPRADILIFCFIGDLEHPDMAADQELGLNQGRPLYVLADASQMTVVLPGNFLNGARHSWFVNPNMRHAAFYSDSTMLHAIAQLVAKVTGHEDRLSRHHSYQEALDYLLNLPPLGIAPFV